MKAKLIFGLIAAVSISLCAISCNQQPKSVNKLPSPDEQQIFIGEDIAVVPTQYGKIRGYLVRNIYTFCGIPYGASTAGENRFMPPQPPEPWDGVRPAVHFGESSPQHIYNREPEQYGAFVDHWNYDEIGEDCLRLNVWTPSINDSKRRPVLVWLHGGGFTNGNGVEHDGYKGENFARFADAVFVSVNHRLGAFGYTDFASVGGEKYKHSGNVGMLDVVAALQWIHDNIENFGGDPNCVTVMGQSGGGSKVCMIATMPSAKGLVHRGVALSGNTTAGGNKAMAEATGEAVLKAAGLTPDKIDELQQMPWEEYLALSEKASAAMRAEGKSASYRPVGDDIDLPAKFFNPDDPNIPDIPMLFCTTFHEWNPNRDDASLEDITFEGVVEKLRPRLGDVAESAVQAYHEAFPECRPIEIWAMMVSTRQSVVRSANVKLGQKSPVYMAWFGMGSPLFDGRLRAFHCSDISFWFYNTDYMITHSGGGKKPRELSAKMASALINFMKTGDPNTKYLPSWPQYSEENGEVMVLTENSYVANDPDRSAREALGGRSAR